MRRLRVAGGLLAAVVGGTATALAAEAPAAWVELRYEARKLLLSAETTVSVEETEPEQVAARLRPLAGPEAAASVGGQLVAVTLRSDLPLGRDESAVAWVRPDSGAAVASEKLAVARRKVWKARLYLPDGLTTWRAAPGSGAEERQPPAAWSKRTQDSVSWQPGSAVVTDSYALLWLLSRVPRAEPGGSLEVAVFADDRLVEVELVGGALHELDADYELVGAEGTVRGRTGPVLAREIRIGARAVAEGDPGDAVDLGFMGMRGELSAFVDLETGVPVEVRGRIGGIGQVTVKLKRAVLAR